MSQLDSPPPAAPPPAGSPFFTIVIATCRRPDLLVLALNSVLAQSFQDFEIVVVDDASPDHTPDVIAQYTDPRITYLRQPTNMGNSHALNRGIQQARGRWVAILDDDDRYPPEFLATVHAALQDAPATVLCAIPARHHVTVTPAGETVLQRLNTFGYRAPRIIAGADFRRNPIGASGGLVVKPHAALAVGGFDPAFYIVRDTDFLLRLATQGDMLVVPAAHLWVYSYPSRDHVTRDFTAYAVNMERLADHHHAALRAHPAPCSTSTAAARACTLPCACAPKAAAPWAKPSASRPSPRKAGCYGGCWKAARGCPSPCAAAFSAMRDMGNWQSRTQRRMLVE